jgi:hypothetical protein
MDFSLWTIGKGGSGLMNRGERMMSPEEIKTENLFPAGFCPLPHPNHPLGVKKSTMKLLEDLK